MGQRAKGSQARYKQRGARDDRESCADPSGGEFNKVDHFRWAFCPECSPTEREKNKWVPRSGNGLIVSGRP